MRNSAAQNLVCINIYIHIYIYIMLCKCTPRDLLCMYTSSGRFEQLEGIVSSSPLHKTKPGNIGSTTIAEAQSAEGVNEGIDECGWTRIQQPSTFPGWKFCWTKGRCPAQQPCVFCCVFLYTLRIRLYVLRFRDYPYIPIVRMGLEPENSYSIGRGLDA